MKSRALLILIVLAAFFSSGWVVGSQGKPHGWEYKWVTAGDSPYYQKVMSQAGADGWELVTVQPIENSSGANFYFKREK